MSSSTFQAIPIAADAIAHDLLLGFVNRGSAQGCVLAALGPQSGGLRWIDVTPASGAIGSCKGVVGLAVDQRRLHVALQSGNSAVVTLNDQYRVLSQESLSQVRDFHSFGTAVPVSGSGATTNKEWLVASTATDEVYAVTATTAGLVERLIWTAPQSRRKDDHHVNSASAVGSARLATMFGAKPQAGWGAADDGRVFSLDDDTTLLGGLIHPHALTAYGDNQWLCCESGRGRLHFDDGDVLQLAGYVRGVAVIDGTAYVGVSSPRVRSKSTHRVNSAGLQMRTTSLHVVDLERRSYTGTVDLSAWGHEIYEVQTLPFQLPNAIVNADPVRRLVLALENELLEQTLRVQSEWIPHRARAAADLTRKRIKNRIRGLLSRLG